MGDDTHSPTVGLVVPASGTVSLAETIAATASGFAERRRIRSRGPGRGQRGPIGESLFDLRMVLDDVTKAIIELEAIRDAGTAEWRNRDLLAEPMSRVGHAMRTCGAVMERQGWNAEDGTVEE